MSQKRRLLRKQIARRGEDLSDAGGRNNALRPGNALVTRCGMGIAPGQRVNRDNHLRDVGTTHLWVIYLLPENGRSVSVLYGQPGIDSAGLLLVASRHGVLVESVSSSTQVKAIPRASVRFPAT
jgi:hypothetical protein